MSKPESRIWPDKDGWSWMLVRGGMIINSGHEATREEAEREVALCLSIAKLLDWHAGR